jgi:hypothetical protein
MVPVPDLENIFNMVRQLMVLFPSSFELLLIDPDLGWKKNQDPG